MDLGVEHYNASPNWVAERLRRAVCSVELSQENNAWSKGVAIYIKHDCIKAVDRQDGCESSGIR